MPGSFQNRKGQNLTIKYQRITSAMIVIFRCHFTLFFLFFSSDKTIEALACQFHEKPFPSSTLLIVYVLLISILHRQELQISSHVAFFLHLFRTSKHVRRQINYEEKQRAVSNNIFRVTGKLNQRKQSSNSLFIFNATKLLTKLDTLFQGDERELQTFDNSSRKCSPYVYQIRRLIPSSLHSSYQQYTSTLHISQGKSKKVKAIV